VQTLIRSDKSSVLLLALAALLFAQAAAGVHLIEHLAGSGDRPALPGHHWQPCLECASFAPVGAAHGSSVTAFAVPALGPETFSPPLDDGTAIRRPCVSFRSRAPPR
jgi:hypothetical protein